jgi:hypothetical protein
MGWNWLLFPFLYWFLVQIFSSFFCLVVEKIGESDGKENQIVELNPTQIWKL